MNWFSVGAVFFWGCSVDSLLVSLEERMVRLGNDIDVVNSQHTFLS